jgi:tripartite-type tricarboxylate transporter receptor subunit TctC
MLRLVKKRFVPALLLMGLAIEIAVAQNYPNKPITLVAPYGVGGDSDFSARNLAPIASKLLGQNVIVQNIAGASGTIGSQKVRTSPPDGYTLLVSRAGSQAIVPALESSTPYKWNDFTFISLLDFNPLVCVVKPDAPYKNMKELIAVIKANPTKLNYSTAGAGTTQHLAVEVLLRDVGLPSTAATMIPYKSAGLATTALLSGEVDFLCNNLTTITGQLKGNAMRPLVTSSSSRLKDFPNIPTAKEEGMGSLEKVMGWSGLYGPPGLPPEVVEKWQAILKEVAKNPTWVNGNDMVGALSAIRSQAETEAFAKEQYELYSKLGSELNLKK